MSYTLVDVDITPYSSADDIAAWIERCEAALRDDPGDEQWRDALKRVLRIKAQAERLALELARDRGIDESRR